MPDFTAEEKTEFSNSLARSTGQLLEIVNNILDISKIEAGQIEVHMTSTCLNNLIRDSVDMFKIRAGEKGLTLQCDFQSNDLQTTIETDETKVIQVINNLLNNAIKFTNSGSVTISTSARSEDILISVEDTGIGIIAEHFHLIFDRFRQVDLARTRQYGGNGLGLSISKSFIEILGGKIWLRSEVDKGTTFYFTLPLTEGTRAIKIKSGLVGPESIPDWIGKSIVVADDDVLVQSFFKEILKKTGAEFHVANNGQNALEYIRRVQAIDLVLLDIKMPDMSGYEVFREIRKELPDIPVIAQTAFAFPEEISEIMTAGFDDILTKPIKIGDLFSICNKLLGH